MLQKGTLMKYLLLAFFTLLPWGSFFFRKVDIWHGQGHFFQMGVLILLCWSFFEKQKNMQSINKALGGFLLWTGLSTGYIWLELIAKTKNYPITVFMPFFNILCVVLLYRICVQYLNKETIEKILKYFSYSIIALLVYSALQIFQLDEFYKALDTNNDLLVGTIGNPAHLAGYLALCQPLFFKKGLRNVLALTLLWLIILHTAAISGIAVGVAVIIFWLLMKRRYAWIGLVIAICAVGVLIKAQNPQGFFGFSSRLPIWERAIVDLRQKAIFGRGFGSWSGMGYQLGGHWRHAHNDYLQIVFENGIVGLLLIWWVIFDYFRMFRTDLTIRVASMFFGFCFLSLFTFNAHLWIISGAGLMAYAFMYVLRNSDENILRRGFRENKAGI